MKTEHQLIREACHLHYYEDGKGNEKALLFLHGASMDHESFNDQMDYFSNRGYRVISVDLRGHGKSKPLGPKYDINVIADDLSAILESLDIESASVIGHSFGSYAGQALLFRHPSRVDALVLIGSTDLAHQGNFFYKFLYKTMPKMLKRMTLESFRDQTLAELALKDSVKDYARKAMMPIGKEDFEKIIMVGMECLYMDCGIDDQYRIKVPFLLTHGDQDQANHAIFPKSATKWLKKEPKCQYLRIPNAGHTAHMDNPEGFNEILENFLKYEK